MINNHESSAAILAHLFQELKARLCEEWLDYMSASWMDASLHQLIVTNGTGIAAKSNEIYGHFHT